MNEVCLVVVVVVDFWTKACSYAEHQLEVNRLFGRTGNTNRAVTSCSSSHASWCVSWLLPVLLHVQMRSLYLCKRASYSLQTFLSQGKDCTFTYKDVLFVKTLVCIKSEINISAYCTFCI